MGMPITSYKVLQLLANPSAARGEDERQLWKVLSEFRLLAVVLHDPSRHAVLNEWLSSNFERLDRITGPHLLFFAAVEATPAWRAGAEERSYFKGVEQLLQIDYAQSKATPTVDPELSVVGSALALGIPAHQLPCIVVFRGGLSEFCWFGTRADTIERQLERLALAAYNLGQGVLAALSGGLHHALADYSLDPHTSLVGDNRCVASRLASILAASVIDPLLGDAARAHIRHAVDDQRRELERLLRVDLGADDDRIFEITRCALGLGITIALSRGGTGQLSWPWPPRNLWELEAAASLATAMKLTSMGDPAVDLPIVMCYGRSFEAEINASIVQGLRRGAGVALPTFYNRHQPGVNACVEVYVGGQSMSIDLNAKRDGGWLPPGLGQSELVANKVGLAGLIEPRHWRTLLGEWSKIRKQRNSAAHPRPLSPASASECHSSFARLHSSGVLSAMLDLKATLRESKEGPPSAEEAPPPATNAARSPSDQTLPRSRPAYRVPELLRDGDFHVVLHQIRRSTMADMGNAGDPIGLSNQLDQLLSIASIQAGASSDKAIAAAAANPILAIRSAAVAAKLAAALDEKDRQRTHELNVLRLNLLIGVIGGPAIALTDEGLTRCLADCSSLVHSLVGALNDVASTSEGEERSAAMQTYSRVCSIVFR